MYSFKVGVEHTEYVGSSLIGAVPLSFAESSLLGVEEVV